MLLAILRKQVFSSVVTKFFASYLVDRFTAYMWGSFRSGPCQADVRVGQGSALCQGFPYFSLFFYIYFAFFPFIFV